MTILFEIIIKWQHSLRSLKENENSREPALKEKKKLMNRMLTLFSPKENEQWLLLCGISIHCDLPEGNHLFFSAF